MRDPRETEPPLEGQVGYKGPWFLARLFRSRRRRNPDEYETEQRVPVGQW